MKKLLTAILALAAMQASAATLDCAVTYNSQGPYDLLIDLNNGDKNKLVGELGEYRIYASLKENFFELQTLDQSFSLRSYASANVDLDEKIELSQWKRETLFEIKCQRVK